MNIKVVDRNAGIEIKEENGKVTVSGIWKGRSTKNKAGTQWNFSWHSKELFDKAIQKYLDGDESVEGGEDDVPF